MIGILPLKIWYEFCSIMGNFSNGCYVWLQSENYIYIYVCIKMLCKSKTEIIKGLVKFLIS